MSQLINDENVDPFNDGFSNNYGKNGSRYSKPLTLNAPRSRPTTSSMIPTLRRGNHLSKNITPAKIRPYNTLSRPNTMTTNSYTRLDLIKSRSGYFDNSTLRPKSSLSIVSTKKKKDNDHQKTSIVVIGDSNCGKTKLVTSYLAASTTSTKQKKKDGEVNLFESYEIDIFIRNYQKLISMQIWDFPGDEMFDRVRPIYYVCANFILICFNFNNQSFQTSLNNIKERWIPEVKTHCGSDVVKYIIGIDRNLNGNINKGFPSYNYFYKFAKSLECKYLECSLDNLKSIEKIFDLLATIRGTQENQVLLSKAKLNGQYLSTNDKTPITDVLYLDEGQTLSGENCDGDELLPDCVGYRKTSFSRKKRACIIT